MTTLSDNPVSGTHVFMSEPPNYMFRLRSNENAMSVIERTKYSGLDIRGKPIEAFEVHQPMIEAAGSAEDEPTQIPVTWQNAFTPRGDKAEYSVPGTAAYLAKVTRPRVFPSTMQEHPF